jgi:hypothetical protein
MKTTKTKPKAAKLTPAQKRVLIAKDVIAQLRAKTLKAERGTYVAIIPKQGKYENVFKTSDVGNVDVSDVLKKRVKRCNVCAVGSVFIAHAIRFNRLPVDDELAAHGNLSYAARGCKLSDRNYTAFPAFMLREMENEFELSHDISAHEKLVQIMEREVAFLPPRTRPDHAGRRRTVSDLEKNRLERHRHRGRARFPGDHGQDRTIHGRDDSVQCEGEAMIQLSDDDLAGIERQGLAAITEMELCYIIAEVRRHRAADPLNAAAVRLADAYGTATVVQALDTYRAEKEKDYARGIELRRAAIHKEPT